MDISCVVHVLVKQKENEKHEGNILSAVKVTKIEHNRKEKGSAALQQSCVSSVYEGNKKKRRRKS